MKTNSNTKNNRILSKVIKNVQPGENEIIKGVIATNGVDPCWAVVAFLSHNYIYMAHFTSIELPPDANDPSTQQAIEFIVGDLYDLMNGNHQNFEIEHVCLLGGEYIPCDNLSNLGFMVKKMCSTSTGTLLFETEDATIKNRLLDFMNKVVYVDLNMNTTTDSFDQKLCEIPLETDLTIIAESFDNMRCISIVLYHGEKILNIYVLDLLVDAA